MGLSAGVTGFTLWSAGHVFCHCLSFRFCSTTLGLWGVARCWSSSQGRQGVTVGDVPTLSSLCSSCSSQGGHTTCPTSGQPPAPARCPLGPGLPTRVCPRDQLRVLGGVPCPLLWEQPVLPSLQEFQKVSAFLAQLSESPISLSDWEAEDAQDADLACRGSPLLETPGGCTGPEGRRAGRGLRAAGQSPARLLPHCVGRPSQSQAPCRQAGHRLSPTSPRPGSDQRCPARSGVRRARQSLERVPSKLQGAPCLQEAPPTWEMAGARHGCPLPGPWEGREASGV